jgi:hypothetical protein
MYGWRLLTLARKHGDETDWSVTNDWIQYKSVERHDPEGQVEYLSGWHQSPKRMFDAWEEIDTKDGALAFRYWYLNPLYGHRHKVDVMVDRRSAKPWPKGSWFTEAVPRSDYRIVKIVWQ